jgi:hypothetical protein
MKSTKNPAAIIFLVIIIILVALTAANFRFATTSPGGADFLTHWIGTRGLFHGESPYSSIMALRVQTAFYGRAAINMENEFLDPYPLYTAIFFSPFAMINDFNLARSMWMTFLEISLLVTFLLSLQIVNWKPKTVAMILLTIFFVLWYNSIRSIINGNIVIINALLLTSSLWFVKVKKDSLAGFFLALATIKPNLALLPGILLILWMARAHRWRFIYWFAGSLAALIFAGYLIIPDWLLQNLENILQYNSYTPPTTVGQALSTWFPGGLQIGWFISAILVLILCYEWFRALNADFSHLLWAFSLTLVFSQWIGISTDPGNFSIFVLPLVYVFSSLHKQPHGTLWLGLILLILVSGLWILFLTTRIIAAMSLQSSIMFFPLPIFLLLGLYIIRRKHGYQNEY